MWNLVVTLLGLLAPPAEYRCLTYNGRTECGYRCDATNGEMGCAQTPDGICVTASGHLTCWDPPEWVRAHYRHRLPKPECLTRAGETACGYHCRSHDGDVKCSVTPDGVCGNSPRELVCWDPAPDLYCFEPGRALPAARCMVQDGKIACGYACVGLGSDVQCASTPGGRCITEQGHVKCFDPVVPTTCEDGKPCPPGIDPRPWCARR